MTKTQRTRRTIPPSQNVNPAVAFFEVLVPVRLQSGTQEDLAKEALNVWWCGKSACNVENDKGQIVEDPSIPWTPQMRKGLVESVQEVFRTTAVVLSVHLLADGTKKVVGVAEPARIVPPSKRKRKPL